MATPADREPNEPQARFGFAFHTPFGTFTDIDDLPQEARAFIVENLDALGLTDEQRASLEAQLHGATPRGPKHAAVREPLEESSAAPDSPDLGPDGHPVGCTCEQDHRAKLWSILDTAFPSEPHLWRAGESLFALSAVNPRRALDAAAIESLRDASRHLEHHAAQLTPPAMSPADSIVERFRQQMDGL